MPLDVGFIGYRFMGRAHANALARLPMFVPDAPGTRRTVLAGRDEAALRSAADRLGFDRTTTDWRDVVDAVDVLYNLAPTALHPEPAIAALEAGVHVCCEKPLAPTGDAADRMAAAARETDAIDACAYNYRFVPALQLANDLLEDGALGEVRYCRGQYLQDWQADPATPWTWRNAADVAGAGAVGDQGSHTIDLLQWLVGEVTQVSGRLTTLVDERPVPDADAPTASDGDGPADGHSDGPADADGDGQAGSEHTRTVTNDDVYTAHLAFEGTIPGMIEGSRVTPGHRNTNAIEVIGSEGALRWDCTRLNELQVQFPDDRGFQTVEVTDETDPWGDVWWPAGHGLGWEHTVVHENAAFLRAVAGEGEFQPDFETAAGVQRVVDAILESDVRGERVAV